jgi:hypothetical protein
MLPPRLNSFPLLLLLALATPASAQDHAVARADPEIVPRGFDQIVYKGLVGNVLDAVPMDAADRLDLQRTNAVVSNTLFGRSLALLAGLSNPVLLLGGFVWGIWSATNIKPAEAGIVVAADSRQSSSAADTQERKAALLDHASVVDNAPADKVNAPIMVSSISIGDPDATVHSRPHVLKIWLPQRSPAPPR